MSCLNLLESDQREQKNPLDKESLDVYEAPESGNDLEKNQSSTLVEMKPKLELF